jgi:tRNA A-37 threonylcarbamoyl transferase component Bud32
MHKWQITNVSESSSAETPLGDGDDIRPEVVTVRDTFRAMTEDARYDWYEAQIASLPTELRVRWENRLNEQGVDMVDTCVELSTFLVARKEAYENLRAGIHGEMSLDEQRACREQVELLLRSIRPDNFLGNGAVADVYVSDEHPGLCLKYIHNDARYREGNHVRAEASFLDQLADFTVEGVRTPALRHSYSGGDFVAIVMERIDGVDLQRVIEGHDELPDIFDCDDYFLRLRRYVEQLHKEKRIYHRDIYPRNLMVDKHTGLPVLIDFGKAVQYEDEGDSNFKDLDEQKDKAQLESAEARVRAHLQNLTKHGYVS